MRSFLILNGETVHLKQYEESKQAYEFAMNYMDHSKEVSVIELKKVHDLIKILSHKEIILEALGDYLNWFEEGSEEIYVTKTSYINKAIEFIEKL